MEALYIEKNRLANDIIVADYNLLPIDAMGFFYHSTEYRLMREGIGDLHCMTEDYIVEDLMLEWNGQGRYDPPKAKLAEGAVNNKIS